jgi:hypothetical protein
VGDRAGNIIELHYMYGWKYIMKPTNNCW